jgi:hypothetical protein
MGTVKYYLHMIRVMTDSFARKRLKVCNSCEHLEKKFLSPSKCGGCGCVVKLKAVIKGEECPLGKWESS